MREKIDKIDIEKHSKYFFIACFIGVIILSVYVIKSFIIAITSGILLSYIFYPLYVKLRKVIRSKNLASLLTAIMVIVIIAIPLVFAANALINESVTFFQRVKGLDLSEIEAKIPESIAKNVNLNEQIVTVLNRFSLSLAKGTSDFLVSLPKRILDIFVILFIMFYLFIEGTDIVKKFKRHIPLKESHRKHLANKFSGVIYASLYGLVVTAIVQGAVGAFGLWLFNVSSPILWGVVMIILAMLPFVGAAFVWFPAAIYKIVVGDIFNGVGLLIYGLFIISTIDNIIRPKIVGSKGKIHPILVLLGVLGGLEVFGLLGIIIGPLILAILMVFLSLYIGERRK